ncbi:MAG: hypothetical protein JXD23_00225 [Spirochaetales bacterium]|nr:hypothetical protein [Spirochaetales bacterium]
MRFLRLVGTLFIAALDSDRYGPVGRARRRRPDLNFRLPALAVLAIVLTLSWFLLLSFYSRVIDIGHQLMRRPDAVFFAAALVGWLVLFFAALPAARSLFLDPVANDLFRSLPFHPTGLSLVRFAALWLLLVPVELFVFLPALTGYLRAAAFDGSVLLGCVVSVALVPAAPAALAVALVTALRRVPGYPRRAAPVEAAGAAAAVLLLAAVQVALQSSLAGYTRIGGLPFQAQAALFLGNLMSAIPPAAWTAEAFRPGSEIVSALLFLGFALVPAAAAVWLAARAFRADAGVVRRAVRAPTRAGRPPVVRGGALQSLLLREASLLRSGPGLAAEAALRLLALPAFLLLYALAGPREATAALSGFISSSRWAALAAIGLTLFLVDASFLAATAVSRESRFLGLSLTLPIDGALQIKAKFYFLLLLSLPPAALAMSLVYVVFRVPAETLVCAVPGAAAYFVLSVTGGLFLDLRRPGTAPPGRFIRQTPSTVLAAAAGAAALAVLGFVAGGALEAGMSPLAAGFLVVVVLAAVDMAIVPRLFRYARRRYAGGLEA